MLLNAYLRVSNNYYSTQSEFLFSIQFYVFFFCSLLSVGRSFICLFVRSFVYFVLESSSNKLKHLPLQLDNIKAFCVSFLFSFVFVQFRAMFSFDFDGFEMKTQK